MGQRVSCPVLVGRGAEVARLRAAIERAAAWVQPATVLVAGEAGIGKTRLVTRRPAMPPVWGWWRSPVAAWTSGRASWPTRRWWRRCARWPPCWAPPSWSGCWAAPGRDWARLVPELGPRNAAGPGGPLAPSQLFELLLGMLHRIAERNPVLLVVEDLHWADQSTRDLLAFLVRNLSVGVALVLTCRSDELHPGIRCGRSWPSWTAAGGSNGWSWDGSAVASSPSWSPGSSASSRRRD